MGGMGPRPPRWLRIVAREHASEGWAALAPYSDRACYRGWPRCRSTSHVARAGADRARAARASAWRPTGRRSTLQASIWPRTRRRSRERGFGGGGRVGKREWSDSPSGDYRERFDGPAAVAVLDLVRVRLVVPGSGRTSQRPAQSGRQRIFSGSASATRVARPPGDLEHVAAMYAVVSSSSSGFSAWYSRAWIGSSSTASLEAAIARPEQASREREAEDGPRDRPCDHELRRSCSGTGT